MLFSRSWLDSGMPQGAILYRGTRETAALFLRQEWENLLGPSLSFVLMMTGSLQDPVG